MRKTISLLIIISGLLFLTRSYAIELENLKFYIEPERTIYDVYGPKIISLMLINNTSTDILIKPQNKLLDARRLTVWIKRGDETIRSQALVCIFSKDVLKSGESFMWSFDLSLLELKPGIYRINFWLNNQGEVIKSNSVEVKIEGVFPCDYIEVTQDVLMSWPGRFNKKAVFLKGTHYYSPTDRILDDSILLEVGPFSQLIGEPKDYRSPHKNRVYSVLVYGVFNYDESKRYGEFGQYKYYIKVDKLVFIDKLDRETPCH